MLNVAIAFRLTWYLFPPNARRRRRPFESAPLHFLPHAWLRVKITLLRQAWWSRSQGRCAWREESTRTGTRDAQFISEERLQEDSVNEWQRTSCDRKININVPINYHENNLGLWPRIYEIQSVFVVSASCDISIKVSSKHLLLFVFKVAPARWKRGDNFCITLFWRKTQNDVRSFRSYIEFIEL